MIMTALAYLLFYFIHPFLPAEYHDRYSKTDALFQREDKIDIRYGETENKCAEKTEGNTEYPGSDQIDSHYIFCLAAASDDSSAYDHILDFERGDHGVGEKDLSCELLHRVFYLIDFYIISASGDDQKG